MRSLLLAAGSILPLLTGIPAQAADMTVKAGLNYKLDWGVAPTSY